MFKGLKIESYTYVCIYLAKGLILVIYFALLWQESHYSLGNKLS